MESSYTASSVEVPFSLQDELVFPFPFKFDDDICQSVTLCGAFFMSIGFELED
jgi:hypothetical protein